MTSRAVEVREATDRDVAKLVPLFEGFYGEWFGEPVTRRAVQRRLEQTRGIETFVVAERDGKPVGFASLRVVPSIDPTPYAELSDLFVAGPHRRQGVGRRILEFVERLARERGAVRLLLRTGLKNVDAQEFYRATGFEDDGLEMRKTLGGEETRGTRELRVPRRSVFWRRVDGTGTESFLLSGDDGGWRLEGTVVALLDRKPAHVRYRIDCDPSWRTRSARVSTESVGVDGELHITVREGGRWWVEGEEDPALRGCTDVDLEISPSTNTLPIRRLNLAVGQSTTVVAAWVRFPGLRVESLQQSYTRTAANRYRYASGTFATDLEVDDLGLVTRYQGGWVRDGEADPPPP